jgi:hypothetical protein
MADKIPVVGGRLFRLWEFAMVDLGSERQNSELAKKRSAHQ